MKTVIFGKGKVGTATDLTLQTNADWHDPQKGHTITDFAHYDLAFICVSSLVDGPNDHGAITQCLDLLLHGGFKGIVAIRCTLSPNYINAITFTHSALRIVHFPEFMKQRDDVYLDEPWAVVLGGNTTDTHELAEFLMERNYGTRDQLHFVSCIESALIKLYQNAGLAIKVVYANMMYEACQTYNVSYENVRRGVTADVRVGHAHTQVPGEDGYGFGGHCLPKDVKCLDASVYSRGFWKKVLDINEELRKKNSE